MYYILALLSGVLTSAMIFFNGNLTGRYGVYSATVIIHIVGLAFILSSALLMRKRLWAKDLKWYFFTGGAIGVATTVFNNMAFGKISVSAILALGLLGQVMAGLAIDQMGLMGMPRHPFSKKRIGGLVLIGAGAASMMVTRFEGAAVFVSFLTGITIVVSRTINARLSERINVYAGTVYNYAVGLAVAAAVCAFMGRSEPFFVEASFSWKPYLYAGGLLGVGVVLLSNITVMKISAFSMSLLAFIGQIFAGILVDGLIDRVFTPANLIGGTLAAAGLSLNLAAEKKAGNKAEKQEKGTL